MKISQIKNEILRGLKTLGLSPKRKLSTGSIHPWTKVHGFPESFNLPDWLLIFSLIIFVLLSLPNWGSIPYLDGNIDFVKNYDFFSGGFLRLLQNWTSVHPPGKEFITSAFFTLFGVNRYSYTIIGTLFGIVGIILLYHLTSKLFGKTPGRVASFLLATNPLFISVGIFSLTDYLLTVFIIGSFYFYLIKKNLLFIIFLSLCFLTKETGLLVPASIVIVELLSVKRSVVKKKPFPFILYISLAIPFFLAFLWTSFLKFQGKPLWSDWNFSETAKSGSLYTVIHNITSFSFFNKYAYQNWLHLFVLNFNWVYWLIAVIGLILVLKKILNNKTNLIVRTQSVKTALAILLFFLIYCLAVLTFQTYTIPRYTLPLIPFLLLGVSESLQIIARYLKLNKVFFLFLILLITGLSLFFSLDPLSIAIWGKEEVLDQEIYAIRKNLAGNDGITYNMQYAFISRKRTKHILGANKEGSIIYGNCYWIFPDPRNDKKTAEILNLNINFNNPCTVP